MPLSREKLEERKLRTEIWTAWVTAISLVIAGLFAAWQYSEAKEAVQTQRALDRIARFSSPELLEARIAVSVREAETAEGFKEALVQKRQELAEQGRLTSPGGDKPNPEGQAELMEVLSRFVLREMVGLGSGESQQANLRLILDFLDETAICAQRNLCDEDVITDVIGNFGQGHIRTYMPYLCYLRDNLGDPAIAQRAEAFFNPGAEEATCKLYREPVAKVLMELRAEAEAAVGPDEPIPGDEDNAPDA